jgi:hypothetical protein
MQLIILKDFFACKNHNVLVIGRERNVAQDEARSGVAELLKRDAFLLFVVPDNNCVICGTGNAGQSHELLFFVVFAEVNRNELSGIIFG